MATFRTPYTDTATQRRVISQMISMLEWTSSPLLKRLSMTKDKDLDLSAVIGGNSKKYEWQQDTLPAKTDQLDGAIDAVQLTFTVDNGSLWHQGHILQMENEYVVVESVTGNTVYVLSRGAAGTTAATHADNTVFYDRGIAKKSMANYTVGNTTTPTVVYNYSQILEEGVKTARDLVNGDNYGISDRAAYDMAKLIGGSKEIGEKGRAGILALKLIDMAYFGKRQAGSDLVPSMAGGLNQFITTNLYGDTSTAFSRDQIHTALRTIYNNGGMADLIVTNPFGAEKIASFYESSIRTVQSEEHGGSIKKFIDTPVIQNVEVLIDWKCPTTKTYILDSERVGWATIRPFKPEKMPSLGDYDVFSVVGEYGFVVEQETSHAIITHSATL